MKALAITLLLALPAAAQSIGDTVDDVIRPGYDQFAAKAHALADAGCDAKAQFNDAFDAWMQVQHYNMGPAAADGRLLAINFWPDPKGFVRRHQSALFDKVPADMSNQSVAARGFPAIERLLYEFPGQHCDLLAVTTADLARIADEMADEWGPFGDYLRAPMGPDAPENAPYLNGKEVRQALFTQLATGLENLSDHRIGDPLGKDGQMQPDRAEAAASGRSFRNVAQSLIGLEALAKKLDTDGHKAPAAIAHARDLAEGLEGSAWDDPAARPRIEALAQALHEAREAALSEIGAKLAVNVGFNAADGD